MTTEYEKHKVSSAARGLQAVLGAGVVPAGGSSERRIRQAYEALTASTKASGGWWVLHDPYDGDTMFASEEEALDEARVALATYAADPVASRGGNLHGLSVRQVVWSAVGNDDDGWVMERCK